jgi:hypothetical protein
MHTGKGFAGLRNMCSKEGGKYARDIPLFMELWADRNEMGRVRNSADICKQ